MSDVLRLRGVFKEYQAGPALVRAVDDVDLDVEAGVMMGLVGPSGSGKTTIAHLIAGWETPTRGVVERSGDVGNDWSSVAVIPQGIGLLEELPLIENIDLPARLGNAPRTPTSDLLARLSLDGLGGRLPLEVSLGEQQRAAVARAVGTRPVVLIADEPTAHQDEANALRVLDSLAACATAGSAVLVATHDPRILGEMDAIAYLEFGRLVRVSN